MTELPPEEAGLTEVSSQVQYHWLSVGVRSGRGDFKHLGQEPG